MSDETLAKASFEWAAAPFFMMIIYQVALLIVGSWNCISDRAMKAHWFGFLMVASTYYCVFRQHPTRLKFDSEARN